MGPTLFRFENVWLEHKHFGRDFERWWKEVTVEGWEGYKWMMRLRKIKPLLKNNNKDVFGDLRLIEATLLNRLKELDRTKSSGNWSDGLREESENLKKELNELPLKKDILVEQKMKIQWVKDGDANSGLFHRVLNARKSKNFISKIELDNGEVLTREEDIVREVVDFFETLYSQQMPEYRGFIGVDWEGISSFSSTWLERPFRRKR